MRNLEFQFPTIKKSVVEIKIMVSKCKLPGQQKCNVINYGIDKANHWDKYEYNGIYLNFIFVREFTKYALMVFLPSGSRISLLQPLIIHQPV